MTNEFVLTMTAANRAGILSAVTRAMSELDGDLRELSQTVVRGYFTMIFSAEFPDHLTESVIRDHIEGTCRPYGIEVGLKNPEQDGLRSSNSQELSTVHTLRIGGDNYAGVLRDISTAISLQQADIVGMRAVRVDERNGFEMVLKVAVRGDFDITDLVTAMSSALSSAGTDHNISVDATDAG